MFSFAPVRVQDGVVVVEPCENRGEEKYRRSKFVLRRRVEPCVSLFWPISLETIKLFRLRASKAGYFDGNKFKRQKLKYAKRHSVVPWGLFENWAMSEKELRSMLVEDAGSLVRVGWASVYRPEIPVTRYLSFPFFICRICRKSFRLHSHILDHELSHGLSVDEIGFFRSSLPALFKHKMLKSFNAWCRGLEKKRINCRCDD